MNDSDLTKLLKQSVKAAKNHRALVQRINAECYRRFGKPYGDLNSEQTIELENSVGGTDQFTAKRLSHLINDPSN